MRRVILTLMLNNAEISLDSGWLCDYYEHEPSLYEFMDSHPIPSLTAWRFDARMVEGWSAYLQRRFDLPLQDVCVNYTLHIDALPAPTTLYLNGRDFGVIDAPFSADVTDFIALDDNRIAFRVPCDAVGGFGRARLIAVPCP